MKNNDTICIILSSPKFSKIAANISLNYGLAVKTAENPGEAYEFFTESSFSYLFLDFDFANESAFELMDRLKEEGRLENCYLLATSHNSNEEFIKKVMSYPLVGYVKKPLDFEQLQDKLKEVLEKFYDGFNEKRTHVRIVPPKVDVIVASMVLKSRKRLAARVIDISLGGIAIELYAPYDSDEVRAGKLIEHLVFNTTAREVDVDALIVTKRGKFLAFKFTHFYNNSYAALSRYIMKNISI